MLDVCDRADQALHFFYTEHDRHPSVLPAVLDVSELIRLVHYIMKETLDGAVMRPLRVVAFESREISSDLILVDLFRLGLLIFKVLQEQSQAAGIVLDGVRAKSFPGNSCVTDLICN